MATPAHARANQKWEAKALDKVLLRIRKDSDLNRDAITAAANAKGESLNQFILTAIRERIERG